MTDDPSPIHSAILELLPDYALGALDDESIARVARHLDGCASCSQEFELLLEVVGVVAPVAPPSPAARRFLFARVAAQAEPVPAPVVTPPIVAPPQPVTAAPRAPVVPQPAHRRRTWAWQVRSVRLAFVTGLIALVIGLGAWNVWLQRETDDGDVIARLITDPAAAHSLTDSVLPTPATGVLYAVPSGDQALLLAHGLPVLPPDQRYQVWLFTQTGERTSGGLFTADANGTAQILLEAPTRFETYWAVGVSAEPFDGSEAPTSPLVLGGWIQ